MRPLSVRRRFSAWGWWCRGCDNGRGTSLWTRLGALDSAQRHYEQCSAAQTWEPPR